MTRPDYHPRELSSLVRRALDTFPVVVITGLRQAGKTTFLKEERGLGDRRYMTLDDFGTLEAARSNPGALLGGAEPLTIDEAQRCPELLIAVKTEVDRDRSPGRFILSGSANLALLRGVSESLAGRALYLTLHPFTRRERLRIGTTPFLVSFLQSPTLEGSSASEPLGDEEILVGGLPPVVTGEARDRDLWFLGYEQTYLERDVRDLSQVADLVSFRNVLRLAAFRTGQILNQSELARDAKLPVSTTSRYLGLLETSFVIDRLPPHLRSRASRLIKSPRLYVTDSGLACHLTATRDVGAAADEPLRGRLYETYVHQNLAGILSAHVPEAELCFWSVQGRHEVDFVVTVGRRVFAIEVKAGSRFGRGDLAGLRSFLAKTPGATAGVLAYNGSEAVALGDELYAVPLGLLLS
jgi:predicted AAA+ superfamily ATPase